MTWDESLLGYDLRWHQTQNMLYIHNLRKQGRPVWHWHRCISCENDTAGSLKFAPHFHQLNIPDAIKPLSSAGTLILPYMFHKVFFGKTHRLGTHSGFGLSSRSIQVGSSPLTSAGSASLALVPAPAAQSPHDNGSRNDVHSWCLYHRCRSHCSGGCCIDWRSCERCRRESCWEEGEELRKNSVVLNWLVVWNMFYFFHILGISSSQLTKSYFWEGWNYTTNQSKEKYHWDPLSTPKKTSSKYHPRLTSLGLGTSTNPGYILLYISYKLKKDIHYLIISINQQLLAL